MKFSHPTGLVDRIRSQDNSAKKPMVTLEFAKCPDNCGLPTSIGFVRLASSAGQKQSLKAAAVSGVAVEAVLYCTNSHASSADRSAKLYCGPTASLRPPQQGGRIRAFTHTPKHIQAEIQTRQSHVPSGE
ncbi:unnamed protein product [Protopolystoma xenopodis]|uniref:Uncharacterized protein n=1 Tax=Protopolystoma xenopodis TaxID=117903 RepID=A0A3S5B147_9PLAT|nr:unnamed protein product [Protopolystoma xenopodis]